MDSDKEQLKRQNTIRFIEAARDLIDTEGFENISIRRIAQKAGFHNSTIYLYFEDADRLIQMATLKHFAEYSRALSELSTWHLRPIDNFLSIWDLYAQSVFENPALFYNFFFGKHSDDITAAMTQYYDLFPEEKDEYSQEIESMYYGKNIWDRSLKTLEPMIREKNIVTEDNIEMINEMIVCYLKYLLEQKCQNRDLNSDLLREKLMRMIRFSLGIG